MAATDAIVSIDSSEEAKRGMKLLSEAVNSVCYKYDADFRDLEKFLKNGAGEKVTEPFDFLPCDPSYNVRHQKKSENRSHDVLGPNVM